MFFKPKNFELNELQDDFPFVFRVFFKKTQYLFCYSKTIINFLRNLRITLENTNNDLKNSLFFFISDIFDSNFNKIRIPEFLFIHTNSLFKTIFE